MDIQPNNKIHVLVSTLGKLGMLNVKWPKGVNTFLVDTGINAIKYVEFMSGVDNIVQHMKNASGFLRRLIMNGCIRWNMAEKVTCHL